MLGNLRSKEQSVREVLPTRQQQQLMRVYHSVLFFTIARHISEIGEKYVKPHCAHTIKKNTIHLK